MSRRAVFLAIATLALASSTLYLARAVKLERARQMQAAGGVPLPEAAPLATAVPAQITSAVSDAPQAADARPGQAAGTAAGLDVGQIAVRRRHLALLLEPAARAERAATLRASLPGAAETQEAAAWMALTPGELARFLDLKVEQALLGQQRLLECELAPDCDTPAVRAANQESERLAIRQWLGPDRLQRFDLYMGASEERFSIMRFRDHLPAGAALSDAAAMQLAMALAEERQLLLETAERMGEKVRSIGTGIFEIRSMDAPDAPIDSPRGLDSAVAYSRRMHDRAAGVLNAEQLALFRQLQDDALAGHRESVHRMATESAIRQAALDAQRATQ